MFTSFTKVSAVLLSAAAAVAMLTGTAGADPDYACSHGASNPELFVQGGGKPTLVTSFIVNTCNGAQGSGYLEYKVEASRPYNQITISEQPVDAYRARIYSHPRYRSGIYRACHKWSVLGRSYTQCTDDVPLTIS